jgi:TPP-dependent pyruvate/acetoin dehydrogenase alpha subunit
LKKKVEDSEAALILVQIQKENEISLLKECIAALETRLFEENMVTQTKINELEAKLADANAKTEKAAQELCSVKIQAKL